MKMLVAHMSLENTRMKKRVALRLPDKLRKELDAVIGDEHSSRSGLIRKAIERYLAVTRFQKLSLKTLPFAEAQGLLTDSDVFNALASADKRG